MRDPELREKPPYRNDPRMTRLKALVCNGPWGADHSIVLIRWIEDQSQAGGGHWVAWQGKDPIE